MSPATVNATILTPALALLPDAMDSTAARVMLLAIGLQESRFLHRKQIGGPARGFWQFERGGGVTGVLTHRTTHVIAAHVCDQRNVDPTPAAVYPRLADDDLLAAVFARLLLYTDPKPLPRTAADGWDCYVRTWRPGKPHRATWDSLFSQAQGALA